jgi:4-amino-4-deoxy-L-arabinose transferase-like glycosyltransferase
MDLPLARIASVYGSENQHFLFSLLAKASLTLWGPSVWAFRLPAVLFGVAGIWAMYLFGREAAGEKEGILSAALLAFSYHHVWFSQNARGYSGLLFWTLFASWLLLRAMREGQAALWAAYAASAALGVYTHATMAFVLAVHAWIAAFDAAKTRRYRGPALGFGLGAVLAVLLHAPALPEILRGLRGTVSVVEEWKSPLWTARELAAGLRMGFAGAAAAGAALAIFAAGAWSFWKTRPVVLALLALPPALGAAAVALAGHHIWPRFFFFAFGFAALTAIRGALAAGRWGTPLAGGLILLSAASVPFAYGPKQDYVAAIEFVNRSRQPGDAVVTVDLASWVYANYFKTGWTPVESRAELEAIRSAASRTWLVYTLEPVLAAQRPQVLALVKSDFRVVKSFPGTLRHGEVVVCRFDAAPVSVRAEWQGGAAR